MMEVTIYVRSKGARTKWHIDDGEREPWEDKRHKRSGFWIVARCGKRLQDTDTNDRTYDRPDDICTLCSQRAARRPERE